MIAVVEPRNRLVRPRDVLRSGLSYWLSSLAAMLRFDWCRMRQWAGMMVAFQLRRNKKMTMTTRPTVSISSNSTSFTDA